MTAPNLITVKGLESLLSINIASVKAEGIDAIDHGLLEAIAAYCDYYYDDKSNNQIDFALGKIKPIIRAIDTDDLWWASDTTIAAMMSDLEVWLDNLITEIEAIRQ
jgi:hypothetical protein